MFIEGVYSVIQRKVSVNDRQFLFAKVTRSGAEFSKQRTFFHYLVTKETLNSKCFQSYRSKSKIFPKFLTEGPPF